MCTDSCEMPKYKGTKTVWALKIKSVVLCIETNGSAIITPEDEWYAPFEVPFDYVRKHNPVAGGYYVVYKDGYKSFSPAEAFKESYLPIDVFDDIEKGKYHKESDIKTDNKASIPSNFGFAIQILKQGKKVARSGWNGKGMYLFLVGSDMSVPGIGGWTFTNGVNDNMACLPFIAMKTVDDKAVPWLASQTDMLAEDWLIVE